MGRLSRAQLSCVAKLLPRRVGLDGGKAKVVGELVLFEVGEDDGGEGGEQRGALIYRAVVDGVPYLQQSVPRC